VRLQVLAKTDRLIAEIKTELRTSAGRTSVTHMAHLGAAGAEPLKLPELLARKADGA
jgi:hypothetical protein